QARTDRMTCNIRARGPLGPRVCFVSGGPGPVASSRASAKGPADSGSRAVMTWPATTTFRAPRPGPPGQHGARLLGSPGQPEFQDLAPAIARHRQVLGLDVAVDQPALVGVLQPQGRPADALGGLAGAEWSCFSTSRDRLMPSTYSTTRKCSSPAR